MEERTWRCPGDFEVTAPTPEEVEAMRARGDDCPARAAFDRVGDRWSILVLYHLVGGPLRFNALRRRIDGLSQRVLTVTLRDLERDGFVTRTQYPTIPPQVDYRPTPLGRALLDAAAPLVAFYTEHQSDIRAHRATYDARPRPETSDAAAAGAGGR